MSSRLKAAAARIASEPFAPLFWIFVLGTAAAIGMLGWQIYSYLRFANWPPLSPIVVLQWLNVDWARAPHDWIGLHGLLDALPLSLLAFAAGLAPIGFWLRGERGEPEQPVDWGG